MIDFFDLPKKTEVYKNVPKNAFDKFVNTKQKSNFSESVKKITWTHKFSSDTTNLGFKDIEEIQLFKVECKRKVKIPKILDIIDKTIPYHIIFWIQSVDQAYISTTSKHLHPTKDYESVIDWAFSTDWFKIDENKFRINLKNNLDAVFKDMCIQIIGRSEFEKESIDMIINNQQEIDLLKKNKLKLKSAIAKCKQFNQRVDLNMKLKNIEKKLNTLLTVKKL